MIAEFQGNYRWLSNFWPCVVEHDSMIFLHAEGAYQAAKTSDIEERRHIARLSPSGAKRHAKSFRLPDNWEQVKIGIMTAIVHDKFTRNTALRGALVATGDTELQEGNAWHDMFWGISPVNSGRGLNHLGKILMQIRKELA